MNNQNLTHSFTVDQTPAEAFAAINDVPAWWSGKIEGKTEKVGDVFTYRYKDMHYSKQEIVESIPGEKVVWLVVDSRLEFVEDKTEWNGTKVTFEIARRGGKTEVRLTHVGLTPEAECYDACSKGWGSLANGNLRSLIQKGKAQPKPAETRPRA